MNLSTVLTWLKTQAGELFATIGNVASNRPEPARQVIIDVVILAALVALVIPRIVKAVSK